MSSNKKTPPLMAMHFEVIVADYELHEMGAVYDEIRGTEEFYSAFSNLRYHLKSKFSREVEFSVSPDQSEIDPEIIAYMIRKVEDEGARVTLA
tara:strand:+ start:1126 stop:1404 length:279 start_codon:yes stop_codon:yes gene_type:complete